MRDLKENEVVIQIWDKTDPEAKNLGALVERILRTLSHKSDLGKVGEIEGPTFHLPDFFSDLYGQIAGFLIYVTSADAEKLKASMMGHEVDAKGIRHSDIDVYTSYLNKLSRKKK